MDLVEGLHLDPFTICAQDEFTTFHEYINENFKKMFIQHSKFPVGALILFVNKKDVSLQMCINYYGLNVATPLWPSVGVKPNTPRVGDLKSSGTPECLEFNSKAQNTSHWGVLGVIGKVLKLRYRKSPRIGHLDICSPSYGQKKGRESNWQFDSRPLKVGNRPLPDL